MTLLAFVFGIAAAPAMAADDGSGEADPPINSLLEKFNIKAKPAAPAPDFVERTRPDPARLHYLPPTLPHTVSPIKVKTPAEIEAQKAALDTAKTLQLAPAPPIALTKAVPPVAGAAARKRPAAKAGAKTIGNTNAETRPATAPD